MGFVLMPTFWLVFLFSILVDIVIGLFPMQKTKPSELLHIGDVLARSLSRYRPSNDLGMMRLWDVWEDALGSEIAANTRPASFKGGVLVVAVASSVWLYQLKFLEQEIMGKLNAHLDQISINRIQYKIASIHP